MPHRLPHLTLALLLAVAIAVVAGGAFLARHTETVRIVRDRAPLRDFSIAMEEESLSLDRLYQGHLRELGESADLHRLAASRSACEAIVGVRQLSLVHGDASRESDQHLVILNPPRGERWPEPVLRVSEIGLPRPVTVLPSADFSPARAERSGWLDRPGEPLLYWLRRSDTDALVVFSLDRSALAAVLDDWFHSWLARGASGALAGLSAAGGPDRILGPGGRVLSSVGSAPSRPESPDFLLPLRTHFGSWQLASWDGYQSRTRYHLPTLVGACLLGLFTALLGLGIFAQQRRAASLAAQRVSFVNRVSHELRTPLTNILLNVDLAAESIGDQTPDTTRRLALVQEETRRLGRLIENVLTFSRREQGKLRLEPRLCIPTARVDAIVEQFAPSFSRRGLAVVRQGEVSTPLFLDPDALAQILSNLLSNIEKYVPGGMITIATAYSDGALSISVSDEGPGIRALDAERVFLPFERLDSRVNEGSTGTGLGLAIARDLASSMGGSLELLPTARGASFQLRIPAPAPATPRLLQDSSSTALSA